MPKVRNIASNRKKYLRSNWKLRKIEKDEKDGENVEMTCEIKMRGREIFLSSKNNREKWEKDKIGGDAAKVFKSTIIHVRENWKTKS